MHRWIEDKSMRVIIIRILLLVTCSLQNQENPYLNQKLNLLLLTKKGEFF